MFILDPAMDLPTAIEFASDLVNNFRDALMYDHFSFMGHRWNSDRNSLGNLIGINVLVVEAGGQLPPGFVYRDYDNNNVPMTATQLGQLGGAAFQFLTAVYMTS